MSTSFKPDVKLYFCYVFVALTCDFRAVLIDIPMVNLAGMVRG
ncbi:hypothetical protein CAter10_3872 [Collimonas arenae]|nr:hypothetical protein CAter10_3872 [Collimonas arenae]